MTHSSSLPFYVSGDHLIKVLLKSILTGKKEKRLTVIILVPGLHNTKALQQTIFPEENQ